MSWILIITLLNGGMVIYGPYANKEACHREMRTHIHEDRKSWICTTVNGYPITLIEWGTIPDPNERWLLEIQKEKLPQLPAQEYEACLKWWDRRGGTDEVWRVCGLPPPKQPLGPN